jgi:hypothetical protein
MWKALAGIVSIAVCLLIAWSLGGAPRWANLLLLVVILLPVAAVVASALRERLPARRRYGPRAVSRRPDYTIADDAVANHAVTNSPFANHALDRPIGQSPSTRAADLLVLDHVLRAIDPRTIDWLRSEAFRSPWRDEDVDPLRALQDIHVGGQPFDDLVHRLVRHLADATQEFLTYYDQNTVFDPLMSGKEWREVGDAATAPDEDWMNTWEPADNDTDGRSEKLCALADRVAAAYDPLAEVHSFTASEQALGRR